MRLCLWVAWRYFRSRNAANFGMLLSAVAIASVAICTFSLIVVMSVMQGFREELATRLVGFGSHITLSRKVSDAPPLGEDWKQRLSSLYDVARVEAFVEGEVIAQSDASGEVLAQGAKVRGIDLDALSSMKKLDLRIYDEAETGKMSDLPRAVIGSEMSSTIVVYPAFHDEVEMVAPLADIGPSGEFVPNRMKFQSVGVFRSGMYDHDSKFAFVPVESARALLGQQAEEGYMIWLASMDDVQGAMAALKDILPEGWEVSAWSDQNKKLFAALTLERFAMGLVLVLALLISSISIAGVIFLITSAKRKDIAILLSAGMRPGEIAKIFLGNAAFVGMVGALAGFILASVLCAVLTKWPIALPGSYYLDYLPVELNVVSAFLLSSVGVLVSMAASAFPVLDASRVQAVEALRYE